MANTSVWAVATIALLAATGCADDQTDPNSPSAARQPARCFQARDARNFRAVNSTTVHVRAGRDTYRIETFGVCPDLAFTQRMGLVTSGGSSTVCVGSGLGTSLVVNGPSGRQRCNVRSITALTPEEVQALQPRHRP